MTDYLHPGKTTTGQYYAEPTFKLLHVMKQKHWRKLSLRSVSFSWQCTSAHKSLVASASSPRLWICSTGCPDLAPSDYFLIRNLKYHLRRTWFIDDESLKIAVEAWSESQNRKFYFQGINSWEEKFENALMLQENLSKNDSNYDTMC